MTDEVMPFSFSYNTQEKTYKILQNLDKRKTCQENGIPVKIIKLHNDIFSYFIHRNFNNPLFIFPQNWKRVTLNPFIKRANLISKIILPSVSFSFSIKFVKEVFLIKCVVTLIKFSLNVNVDSDKVATLDTTFLS